MVFQSTPSQRGRQLSFSYASQPCRFQSTPSQRGRLGIYKPTLLSSVFQSTPSQRGRRFRVEVFIVHIGISIHALAKRATIHFLIRVCLIIISIHALAKRATVFTKARYNIDNISIHALAKRATIIFGLYFIKKDYFNPRPRKEGDVWAYAWCRLGSEFQSTPSQRGRLTLTCTDWELLQISIHALAKRATTCIKRHIKKISLFQSTPSQRGRHSSKHCSNDFFDISIHALAKRATYTRYGIRREMTDFNPRPRKEGDCTAYNTLCCIILFQSTPSQRGRRLKLSCDSIKLSISIHALAKRATANLYNDYLYFEAKYHISDIFPL